MAHNAPPSRLFTTIVAFRLPGGWEWIAILLVVLVLFGHRIPGMARSLGSGITEFKRGLKDGGDGGEGDRALGDAPADQSGGEEAFGGVARRAVDDVALFVEKVGNTVGAAEVGFQEHEPVRACPAAQLVCVRVAVDQVLAVAIGQTKS